MKHKKSHVIERECQIWLDGCNGSAGRCHYRLHGISGIGLKVPDIFIAYGCMSCHNKVDTDKSDAVQLQFAHAVFRTQMIMLREGMIHGE